MKIILDALQRYADHQIQPKQLMHYSIHMMMGRGRVGYRNTFQFLIAIQQYVAWAYEETRTVIVEPRSFLGKELENSQ